MLLIRASIPTPRSHPGPGCFCWRIAAWVDFRAGFCWLAIRRRVDDASSPEQSRSEDRHDGGKPTDGGWGSTGFSQTTGELALLEAVKYAWRGMTKQRTRWATLMERQSRVDSIIEYLVSKGAKL
jgi:hypothetical protein